MSKLREKTYAFLSISDVSAIKDMMAKTAKDVIIHAVPHPVKTVANAHELDYTILPVHVRKVSFFTIESLICFHFSQNYFWQQEMCIFTN